MLTFYSYMVKLKPNKCFIIWFNILVIDIYQFSANSKSEFLDLPNNHILNFSWMVALAVISNYVKVISEL